MTKKMFTSEKYGHCRHSQQPTHTYNKTRNMPRNSQIKMPPAPKFQDSLLCSQYLAECFNYTIYSAYDS